jgi:hypothetical protein
LKEPKQHFGIEGGIIYCKERRIITGLLGEIRETAVQPPGKWAEPEDRPMYCREQQCQCISPGDV